MMPWTQERTTDLKGMWADGLSASQCAAKLGGTTRNAVIGKVTRLGLGGRKARENARIPRRRKTPSGDNFLKVNIERRATSTPLPLPPPEPAADVPHAQRCTLLQLTETTCRWPYGDPGEEGFFFCGAVTVDGLPYCASHARDAFHVRTR